MTHDIVPPRSVADLCAATGLDRGAVYRAIQAGELPGQKFGNRYVIPGAAFEAWCRGEWTAPPRPQPTPIRPLIHTRKERHA